LTAANSRSRRDSVASQRGVSLIEVLVAVVILTIGLLGLAGLQASGMRVGHSSFYRTQANQLAFDVADRMRANPSDARAGNYARPLSATIPAGNSAAERDLADWMRRVRALPNGQGGITFNDAIATIVVQWDDQRGAVNDAKTRLTDSAQQVRLEAQIWAN
jgi:type IV pilus assembly protein PilV